MLAYDDIIDIEAFADVIALCVFAVFPALSSLLV